MTTARWSAVCIAAALFAGACSSDSTDADSTDASSTDSGAAEQLPDGADRLVGRYGHYDIVAYLGEDLNTLIISYGLSDLEIRDGEMWTTQQFCHAEQVNNQPITTSLSDAATQAIVPPSTPVTVTAAADGRFSVHRPATPTTVGIRLDDPANETLPTDPDDPRIVDDDGDGQPGITVSITGSGFAGDLYIARREIFAYDLVEQADGRLVGTVTDDSEQLLIGATDSVLIASGDWEQHPDPDKSPIVWTPVDAGMTCDELTDTRLELFGDPPAVDY